MQQFSYSVVLFFQVKHPRQSSYITLSEHADAAQFEQSYFGHIQKLFDDERTYYAVDREIFSSQTDVVTHGGSHFLEVIIPFFTITTHL